MSKLKIKNKDEKKTLMKLINKYAERVNASAVIVQLFQIIEKHNLDIGSRLEATMLYLYNVPDNQVYVDRFDIICSKLQTAIDEDGTSLDVWMLSFKPDEPTEDDE